MTWVGVVNGCDFSDRLRPGKEHKIWIGVIAIGFVGEVS